MTENFAQLLAEGHQARREGRLPAARAAFIDVVRKAAEAGDRESLAEALNGLAEAENGIGNCEAARHHYANAVLLYRQMGASKPLAGALRHEAEMLVNMKRASEAEPLLLEANGIDRKDAAE
jgi:tetratricopeptide (TPR) repeat protein